MFFIRCFLKPQRFVCHFLNAAVLSGIAFNKLRQQFRKFISPLCFVHLSDMDRLINKPCNFILHLVITQTEFHHGFCRFADRFIEQLHFFKLDLSGLLIFIFSSNPAPVHSCKSVRKPFYRFYNSGVFFRCCFILTDVVLQGCIHSRNQMIRLSIIFIDRAAASAFCGNHFHGISQFRQKILSRAV